MYWRYKNVYKNGVGVLYKKNIAKLMKLKMSLMVISDAVVTFKHYSGNNYILSRRACFRLGKHIENVG